MRYKGRISNWKDERGFGFITPMSDGPQAFAHIKAFANRRRRPVAGDVVTYALRTDAKGRTQAVGISFVGDDSTVREGPRRAASRRIAAPLFCAAFIGVLVVLAWLRWLPLEIPLLYFLASVITFFVYAFDKSDAVRNRRRTREKTLLALGLLGGWPGALLAQRLLRHKSSKASFQVAFRVTVALNCFAVLLSSPQVRAIVDSSLT